MRYIGNKTKLLDFIDATMDALGLKKGVFCDPFAGTASVARHMKSRGFQVVCADLMRYSFVLQWAYVVANQYPKFLNLPPEVGVPNSSDGQDPQIPLHRTIQYLNGLEDGSGGFIYRSYSPGGSAGRRMYFTDQNGRKIDAIRKTLDDWRQGGRLCDDEYYLLLAALLESVDAVANISGVYCAFLKGLQPNARRQLRLRPPQLVTDNLQQHRALQGDANELISSICCDILYLDPPYNVRQYACNYHLLETIAEGWAQQEPQIYGKTGMRPYKHQRSRYCSRRGGERALRDLVEKARDRASCTHLLLSYNDEGVIPPQSIERIMRETGKKRTYRKFERTYKRFRSDSDGPNRTYHRDDRVTESLYYIRLR
jgi:adenine-specific DNA-methyltransferase